MRNDCLDRFGTKYEKRYSKSDIVKLFKKTGYKKIKISNQRPFWCAIGFKYVFMCGITGFILDISSSSINFDIIKKMTNQLVRRGTDS